MSRKKRGVYADSRHSPITRLPMALTKDVRGECDIPMFKNGAGVPCRDCGGTLSLRRGSQKTAHYGHISSNNPSLVCSGAEAFTLSCAKELMATHLNSGDAIKVDRACVRCGNVQFALLRTTRNSRAVEGYTITDACVGDVVVVEDQGGDYAKIVFIAEVYSHAMIPPGGDRDAYTWYQFSASDILGQHLDCGAKTWSLSCKRMGVPCVLACPTPREIAIRIGAYQVYSAYETELHRSVDIACSGSYREFVSAWHLPEVSHLAWEEKATMNRLLYKWSTCLRCARRSSSAISVTRPFCVSCCTQVNKHEGELARSVVESWSLSLRDRFEWLRSVPEWFQFHPCTRCLTVPQQGSCYIFYFGRRNICSPCFVAKQAIVDDAMDICLHNLSAADQ